MATTVITVRTGADRVMVASSRGACRMFTPFGFSTNTQHRIGVGVIVGDAVEVAVAVLVGVWVAVGV
jgi:hypothetical protein